MSERSKAWQSKKALLDQKEQSIREELEESSTLLESKTKKIITISLIVGGVALLGYLAYKSFSKTEDQEEEEPTVETKKKKPSKNGPNFLTSALLSEPVISSLVGFLVNKLSSKKENSEEED